MGRNICKLLIQQFESWTVCVCLKPQEENRREGLALGHLLLQVGGVVVKIIGSHMADYVVRVPAPVT